MCGGVTRTPTPGRLCPPVPWASSATCGCGITHRVSLGNPSFTVTVTQVNVICEACHSEKGDKPLAEAVSGPSGHQEPHTHVGQNLSTPCACGHVPACAWAHVRGRPPRAQATWAPPPRTALPQAPHWFPPVSLVPQTSCDSTQGPRARSAVTLRTWAFWAGAPWLRSPWVPVSSSAPPDGVGEACSDPPLRQHVREPSPLYSVKGLR